jgi:prepilin-type N-terminal cleavage/methylation domain-containing protein
MPQDRKTRRISTLAAGFTLIELLVTLVIISILASLSLAGMVGARQRSKIDKTNSTIRKLHEIVIPQYESYLSRRVTTAGIPTPSRTQCSTCYKPSDPDNTPSMTGMVNAWKRLIATRRLMVQEMPDQWADVYPSGLLTLPGNATAPTRRHAAYKASLSAATGTQWSANRSNYEGAECLAMIVTRGGFAPDATEMFRNDELGDIDNDGAPEFWDAWGIPIGFIRWPGGFASSAQPLNATTNPDPFDPMKVSGDYALLPLIYSSGPNGATDDPLSAKSGYSGSAPCYLGTQLSTTLIGSPLPGSINDSDAAQDNITNHDLMTK